MNERPENKTNPKKNQKKNESEYETRQGVVWAWGLWKE